MSKWVLRRSRRLWERYVALLLKVLFFRPADAPCLYKPGIILKQSGRSFISDHFIKVELNGASVAIFRRALSLRIGNCGPRR